MKRLAALLVVLLFNIGAHGAEPGDHPIGVETKDWIRIGENLGFIVVATKEPVPRIQGPSSLLLLNKVAPDAPAAGYFMINGENGWRRLVVFRPDDVVTAAKN